MKKVFSKSIAFLMVITLILSTSMASFAIQNPNPIPIGPTTEVSPIFEGWVDNGDGTYKAFFGYENKSKDILGDPRDVTITLGTNDNKVTGNIGSTVFPETFTYPSEVPGRPGRTPYFPDASIVVEDWDGSNIVWTLNGKTATASLNGSLEHKEEIKVSPIFEGWVDNNDGTYRAFFGYENKSKDAYGDPMDVTFTFGTNDNKVTGNIGSTSFPETFTYPNEVSGRPGRTPYFPDASIVVENWDGSNIVWNLNGKTATASLNASLEHKEEIKLSPIFEGWVDNNDGTYRAFFGYENKSEDAYGNPMDVTFTFGSSDNKVTGNIGSTVFPETFTYPNEVPGRPGRTPYFPDAPIVVENWDGSNIVWTLNGKTATASLNASLEHKEEVKVSPIFEGWVDNNDGTYRAFFGYENKSLDPYGDPMDVTFTFGSNDNKVTGDIGSTTFPETFTYPNEVTGRPGRTPYFPDAPIVVENWDGSNIVWTLNGKTATASLNGSLEHKEEIKVSPIFEGWVDNNDGTYRAFFGYENKSLDPYGDPMDVTFTFGSNDNKVTGDIGSTTFPETFTYPNEVTGRPGRTPYFPDAPIVVENWDGSNIVWNLDGKTATASLNAGLEHKEEVELSPIFEGWVDNNDGTYRAFFGYENKSLDPYGDPMDVNIPLGNSDNKVTGNIGSTTFPETFTYPNEVTGRPGRTPYFPDAPIVVEDWDGSNIVWTLNGKTATASLNPGLEQEFPEEPEEPEEPTPTPTPAPTPAPVPFVVISDELVELEYGSDADDDLLDFDLDATVFNSGNTDVTWSSSDEDVATVDENGIVTAVSQGEVTITVTHTISGATDTGTVIVFLVGDEETPLGSVAFFEPYIVGYPDGTFKPGNFVTRAEVATIFARILNLNVDFPGQPAFTDVPVNTWYYANVQAVQRAGIFNGTPDGKFKPESPITREEIANVFSNYFNFSAIPVTEEATLNITDVGQDRWSRDAIYKVVSAEFVDLEGNNTFRPEDPTLRHEIVSMINRLIGRPSYTEGDPKFDDVSSSHPSFGEIEAASQNFFVTPE